MSAEGGAQPGAGGLTARALGLLAALGPERAHGVALAALRTGLVPLPGPITTPRLATEMAGLALPNPLGLAAGFDKNAEALAPLGRAGFGFVEIGAVTPRAQPGNPRPRLFRLAEDRAAINRFGFNNEGMEAAAARLARRRPGPIVGLNLGANRDSSDLAGDYCAVLTCCGPHVDFATVNVSSPNTAALRNFDDRAALESLLARVMAAQAGLARPIPIFLKITPDLELDDIAATAELAVAAGVHGIIATNTTRSREGLKSGHAPEAGGLSGAPLFARSTRVLAHLARASAGRLVLVGVGGVENAETAYAKIRAGASAVQLYTALAYGGMGLVREILTGLDAALARDGFASVAEAVGCATGDYL